MSGDGSGLTISKAQYGVQGNFIDVTSQIQNLVQEGAINLTVGAQQIGILDPAPGVTKALEVTYLINGKNNVATINDGAVFSVNAPSLGTKSKTANQAVGSIASSFFSIVAHFIGMFLTGFAAGLGAAWITTGNPTGSKVLGAAFGLFLWMMSPFLFPIAWVPFLLGFFGY